MISIIVTVLVLGFILLHLDKLKYLKYIPMTIWGFIKAIPDLLYAALKLIQATFLYSLYAVLTWAFWPIAIYFIVFRTK